jgi:hypothetical protein
MSSVLNSPGWRLVSEGQSHVSQSQGDRDGERSNVEGD